MQNFLNLQLKFSKHTQTIFAISVIILLSVSLTGCWDRSEPENKAFVLGTGFDYLKDDELYQVTIQVADPTGMEGGNGLGGGEGGNGGGSIAVTSAKGQTPYQAVKNLQLHMSREPFFGHNKLLVISESLARKGLGPVLDYFDRERETRLIAFPIILDDAHDLTEFFRTELPFEAYMSEGVERHIAMSVHERAVFPSKSLIESFSVISKPGRETLIGKAELGEQEDEDRLGEEDEAVRGTTHLEGGAVFKEDQMQGWFDQDETSGWFWIQERVQVGVLVVNCPVHDQHPITIEIFDSESQVTPIVLDNGNLQVNIDILADGIMQDQTCPYSYEEDSDLITSIENRAAAAITNEVTTSIDAGQKFEADVFGFGNAFYRKHPEVWENIEEQWHEHIFTDLDTEITVDFNLRRSGLVTEPLITE